VLLSCCTSVHYAEMAGLRWRRVNLTAEPTVADGKNLPPYTVAVRQGFYRGEFGPPKNAGRNRIERMPNDVVAALLAHRAQSKFTGPDDLVFCNPDGSPLDEDRMRRKLTAACKKAGIAHLGWHAFRRYFATQSDRKGMHPLDRQHSLGHASQEMTARYTTQDLERRTPHVERICRGLLDAAATSKTPAKAS
jgi:integrase